MEFRSYSWCYSKPPLGGILHINDMIKDDGNCFECIIHRVLGWDGYVDRSLQEEDLQ